MDAANRPKRALITGITGQDGAYLTGLLLEKGYEVHGIIRRSSSFNTGRLDEYYEDMHEAKTMLRLHYGDLGDSGNLVSLISKIQPDEVYNLAAQSHVKVSFELPDYTGDITGVGTLRLLEAIRICGMEKKIRFYQASTSELFGGVQGQAQNESTPFYPRSPYAVAKQFAYWSVVNYREAYGMHASNGILFNHESPKRGATFVTRKITRAVAMITEHQQKCLYLGNLEAQRDWGHARDYVKAMWMMVQQPKPDDYVISTFETHTVREFVEKSFAVGGIEIKWKKGERPEDEIGYDAADRSRILVRIDPRYYRPTEVDFLLGDCSKAKEVLGWQPATSFDELVHEMVTEDVKLVKRQKILGPRKDGESRGI